MCNSRSVPSHPAQTAAPEITEESGARGESTPTGLEPRSRPHLLPAQEEETTITVTGHTGATKEAAGLGGGFPLS